MRDSTKSDIDRYVAVGCPPGDFLHAVLSNDLKESFARADEYNRDNLFSIVRYLYNEVPGLAWGSPEKVKLWLMHSGRKGLSEHYMQKETTNA